jgi:hypothetical protein
LKTQLPQGLDRQPASHAVCKNSDRDLASVQVVECPDKFIAGECDGIPVGHIAGKMRARRPGEQYRRTLDTGVHRQLSKPEQALLEVVVVAMHKDHDGTASCCDLGKLPARKRLPIGDGERCRSIRHPSRPRDGPRTMVWRNGNHGSQITRLSGPAGGKSAISRIIRLSRRHDEDVLLRRRRGRFDNFQGDLTWPCTRGWNQSQHDESSHKLQKFQHNARPGIQGLWQVRRRHDRNRKASSRYHNRNPKPLGSNGVVAQAADRFLSAACVVDPPCTVSGLCDHQ